MSTPENTSNNRKLLDEVRDVMRFGQQAVYSLQIAHGTTCQQ